MFSDHKEIKLYIKKRIEMVMMGGDADMLSILMVVIISQCMHTSKHQVVHSR